MFSKKHTKISQYSGVLFTYLIKPTSKKPDTARREFILNILLLGIIFITLPAFLINLFKYFFVQNYHELNPAITGIVLSIFSFLLYFSRIGKSKLVSFIFISLLFLFNLLLGIYWGPDGPELLLIYSLLITMTSILLDSKSGVFVSLISGITISALTLLKIKEIIVTDDRWRYEVIHFTDAIVYAITLGIIALVSWLFNREMEKALSRARYSEQALKRQRDKLEITVEKRTKQLRQAQVEKVAQLYRFAEFGKSASGLFHDLANPLTLVSLNLKQLNRQVKQPKLVETEVALQRAITGTKRLENFIYAARKQIQDQEVLQKFSLKKGINQAIQMFEYKARKTHINIFFQIRKDIKIFGNPVKFNQLITNLLSNAIDSFDNIKGKKKHVEIRLSSIDNTVKLEIQDWGSGINPEHLPKIFDPLFTTKDIEKGTGIGLSICKDIVEKSFKGTCSVESKKGVGTTFIIEFPIRYER